MRKYRIFLLALCSVFLIGCGKTDENKDSPAVNADGKIEIVISGVCWGIENVVKQYNESSDKYVVVTDEAFWHEAGGDYDTRCRNAMLKIVEGKGPDIFTDVLFYDNDIIPLARKGALMDMTDFLAEQDYLLPDVLKSAEWKGRYYGVPINFCIDSLVTTSAVALPDEEWTVENCMESFEKSGIPVFMEGDRLNILRCLYNDQFIDRETMECHFDCTEFRKILEFVKKYSAPDTEGDILYRVQSGEVGCVDQSVRGASSLGRTELYWNGRQRYVGYPTSEGSKYRLFCDVLFVNANTKKLEGVLDFLRFYLSYDIQKVPDNLKGMTRIDMASVRKDVMEEQMSVALNSTLYYHDDDGRMHETQITEKHVEEFWKMLRCSSASLETRRYDTILNGIVWNEAEKYWSGERPLDEIIDHIQNRVQLMLEEQK